MVNALLLVTIGLPNLISVRTVRNDIVEIHLSEGHVEHHTVGHARSDEKVIIAPLDVVRAMRPDVYRVNGTAPIRVARKSKGTDFAWFVDRWAGDHAENSRPDHVKDHWIYLTLPKPLREGQTVAISAAGVIAAPAKFTFSAKSTISEAVHVNLLGYARDEGADLGGRLAALLGQLSNFVGYDGETSALLSGARGFNCRIQRQQVRLLRDLIDGADDLANLAAHRVELLYSGSGPLRHLLDSRH